VNFVHERSPAKICLQLGHAGRKGSTQLGWEQIDYPLPQGNWELISASPLPYLQGISQMPRAMTEQDMDEVRQQFVRSAELGAQAGFDMLELHMAHGYLLASFLSPLSNQRTDRYGGSLENRLRFPLSVLQAVRAVWPEERPISVRISATDWAPGGLSEADLLQEIHLDTPWVKGVLPRYEFIQHVFNHSTYHRGQAVSIGRMLGYEDAPMTDYNFYNMVALKRGVEV